VAVVSEGRILALPPWNGAASVSHRFRNRPEPLSNRRQTVAVPERLPCGGSVRVHPRHRGRNRRRWTWKRQL